ncbi:MAG: serine/threonine protein kinase [Chitinophagales bacterium]|nr:serine/threonine protein kinase [Chitinophagales bacterium]
MIKECKILEEIAEGGQKKVFLAEHPDVGKVVLKIGEIRSFTSLERIKREVELLTGLDSEYYPKQYYFNIDVIAMKFDIIEQYIEGKTLRDSMTEFNDTESILRLISELINGLSIIWGRNIVHRDLKPENIIIKPNGLPCILDLGIARFLDLEALTKTISPMGPCTPIYASPEQLTNNKNIIDQRTDFFSLGIMALELFLGVHPFDPNYVRNKFSIVENIMQNNYITEIPTVKSDEKLKAFAKKTLQTQPFNRFRNFKILNEFIAKNI